MRCDAQRASRKLGYISSTTARAWVHVTVVQFEKAVIIPDVRIPNPIRTVGDHIRSRRLTEASPKWPRVFMLLLLRYFRTIPIANYVIPGIRTARCRSRLKRCRVSVNPLPIGALPGACRAGMHSLFIYSHAVYLPNESISLASIVCDPVLPRR